MIELDEPELLFQNQFETQLRAYHEMEPMFNFQAKKVLGLLRILGEAGYNQIAALGNMRPSSVDRCLNELHSDNMKQRKFRLKHFGSEEPLIKMVGTECSVFNGKKVVHSLWALKGE